MTFKTNISMWPYPKLTGTGLFDSMDDWLRGDCFVFVGWSGLLLFPCAYFSLGGWFTMPMYHNFIVNLKSPDICILKSF